ncbi:SDR family oxidoreductase [Rhodococcus sp. USK13]|uniref:SDR family NAD(P)-dependent oxidoreductase n=1 Tax=Rhodococcus sp. USK13 TaxID=2806442 RepID=UPI0020169943|nr:SDR family oxidoreductase [Rhodococcus sp. USK13]
MSAVSLITGAAAGVGEYIARRLHARGDRVVIADIDDERAAALAAELSGGTGTARAARLDVAHKAEFERVLAEISSSWGIPDVLVNNAAKTVVAPVMTIDEASFADVLTTNAGSVFHGCQVIGGAMAERGSGRIVNMASLAGQNGGTATGAHYAASKGAILTVTKIFAKEFAQRGVTVNAIAPGPHDVPSVRAVLPPDRLDAIVEAIPVRRLGNADFLADTAALLSAPNAHFVTGACWDINGGLLVR